MTSRAKSRTRTQRVDRPACAFGGFDGGPSVFAVVLVIDRETDEPLAGEIVRCEDKSVN